MPPRRGRIGRVRRRFAIVLIAVLLGSGAACSAGDSPTRCGVDGCTVSFPRSGDTSVSVLGVDARLVGVQNGVADIEVAGQRVSVPVGGETQAQGFAVGVQEVTETAVVVRIRLA